MAKCSELDQTQTFQVSTELVDQDGPGWTKPWELLETEARFFLAALLALFTDVLAYDDNLTGNSSEAAFVSLGLV